MSKTEMSVVYVSFGSLCVLSNVQMDEVARALLDCGFSFVWVIRENEEELKFREELEKKGKIVKWCAQVEILSHSSVGCFLTHCGWNSMLECLVSEVPVVAFPQWSDQTTNAKLDEDVWKIGVRVDVNEDGIVGGGKNAMKWKVLGREAGKEGGPAENNLRAFLNDVGMDEIFMHEHACG